MSGLENGHRLKQLQTRRSQLEIELKELNESRREIQDKVNRVKDTLNSINAEVVSLENTKLVISEHALLRYLQRAKGIDLEQMKAEMINDKTINLINTLGTGKYPIGKGCRAIVKGRTVVSVVKIK